MKTIYLVRHAHPELNGAEHLCIGRTDLPLSPLGRMQCVLLQETFRESGITAVYHSGMRRTEETARALSDRLAAETAFREIDVGEWEGKTFREIRQRYPEVYAIRGKDPYRCCIPGGEAPRACLERAGAALQQVARQAGEAPVAIVAHAGVNRLLLCALLEKPMEQYLEIAQPYGCVNTLRYEDGKYTVESVGEICCPVIDDTLAERLYQAIDLPVKIRDHCKAVAQKALQLAQGRRINRTELYAAALLHDICRQQKNHAQVGAQWVTMLGYPRIGTMIASHHDPGDEAHMTEETMLLYMADKLIYEEREVTLEERFAISRKKTVSAEAMEAHERRYMQAKRIQKRLCGDCLA